MKKIISVIMSIMFVFSTFTSNADTTSLNNSEPTVETADTAKDDMMEVEAEETQTDSAAGIEISVEEENKTDAYSSASETFASYKAEFLNSVKEGLRKVNENIDTNEYVRCDFIVGLNTKKYRGAGSLLNIDKKIDEAVCDEIYSFAEGLYDVLGENITYEYKTDEEIEKFKEIFFKKAYMQTTNPEKEVINFRIDLYTTVTSLDSSGPYLSLEGNYLSSPHGKYYYVDNSEEVFQYVAENYFGAGEKNICYKVTRQFRDLTYSQNKIQYLDYENKIYKGEAVNIIDKLTFDIKLTDEYKGSFFDFLGDPGTVVKCRIVQTTGAESNSSKLNDFVLTAVGTNATMEFSTDAPSNWGYEGTSNFMDFADMRITGVTQANSVRSVAVTLYLFSNFVLFESIPTENMTYEFYYDGNEVAERRAMYKLFGIEKGDFYFSQSPSQDPENYVTQMRHSYELSGKQYVWDYDINFVAVMPIKVNSKASPDWYLALGDDVTATIVGVATTLNGKERNCYNMVKFTGSKSSIWFDMASGSHRIDWDKTDYTAEDNLEMKLEYDSLLSFDGNEKIQNTLDKEYIDARIYFSHEDFSIKSIEFDIGLITDEVTADEINYIGGGKEIYRKFM